MVEVQCLAVEVARGFADLEELLDLRVGDVEVAGGRTAAERALADRKRQRVHHPDEGDDAAGLAVQSDRLADAAHRAPISADAAALGGKPDILVPGVDDAVEAVVDAVQIAADRQAAAGAAVRQHGGCRHEPQLGDIVVDALGMALIVGIGRRDAGEQILVGFAGQQIAVAQRVLAEFGQKRVAVRVGFHVERAGIDRLAGPLGFGDRNVVGAYIARGRKIHLFSPCYWPFCDGLFCFCSTRCHGAEPSPYSSSAGHFVAHVPDIHRAQPSPHGR